MPASLSPVRIDLDRSSDRSHDVVFDQIAALPQLMSERGMTTNSCLVITDSNVARHHGGDLDRVMSSAGWAVRRIVVEPGEPTKSMSAYARVLDEALAGPIDRQTPVLALGGGVVGDLAGFVAATLLRGLPFVQVPTSLVAQVDSAIGGKTGINHAAGKNMIGSFYQPRIVLVDVDLLQTLPDREWAEGLSEVVKYALIADADFASSLLNDWERVVGRDRKAVGPMIHRCVEIKAHVVSQDETEQGVRAILNFGHTFGHALERVGGYENVTHGQAVAIGMRAALRLSATRHPGAALSDAIALVQRLPNTTVTADIADLMEAMATDKKKREGSLRFITLERTGRALVERDVGASEIHDAWLHALHTTFSK